MKLKMAAIRTAFIFNFKANVAVTGPLLSSLRILSSKSLQKELPNRLFRQPSCCLSISSRLSAAKKDDDGNKADGPSPILDFPDMGPGIPVQKARLDEATDKKRARLFYQSRKRGISENGLLLSTFASKYLQTFSEELLNQYDTLLNQPSNDWEIYYWMTEKKPTPSEYDNEIMDMLKEHTRNDKMETRYRMPDLNEETTPTTAEQ